MIAPCIQDIHQGCSDEPYFTVEESDDEKLWESAHFSSDAHEDSPGGGTKRHWFTGFQESTSWYCKDSAFRHADEGDENEGWEGSYNYTRWAYNEHFGDSDKKADHRHRAFGGEQERRGNYHGRSNLGPAPAAVVDVVHQHLQSLCLEEMPKSVPELRAAFKGAAKLYHPDMVTSRVACVDRFLRAQQAYNFLKERVVEQ
jgi:hypothetical protein